MKIFFKLFCLLLFILSFSCTRPKNIKPIVRSIAQVDYVACHVVEEELLIEEVNFSIIPKTFENVKNYVFKNHCASCHFGKDSYLPHLDDYESVKSVIDFNNLSQSKLIQTISKRKMPPSYSLMNRDYDAFVFLKDWVDGGAL